MRIIVLENELLWWSGVKDSSANAGDPGSILGPGRFHMLWDN